MAGRREEGEEGERFGDGDRLVLLRGEASGGEEGLLGGILEVKDKKDREEERTGGS